MPMGKCKRGRRQIDMVGVIHFFVDHRSDRGSRQSFTRFRWASVPHTSTVPFAGTIILATFLVASSWVDVRDHVRRTGARSHCEKDTERRKSKTLYITASLLQIESNKHSLLLSVQPSSKRCKEIVLVFIYQHHVGFGASFSCLYGQW